MRLPKPAKESSPPILLSPLIDCVFLLLIFFLVTSMIKRYERMIPLTLADPTASITQTVEEDVYQMAVGNDGQLYAEAGRGSWGSIRFQRIEAVDPFLDALLEKSGQDQPIQVRVDREVPFQSVIRYQDMLENRSFRNVRFRVSDRGSEVRRDD